MEVLDDLVAHEATRAVVLYLEGFADGRALLGAMARLGRRHGVPTPVTDTVYGVLTLEDRRARGTVQVSSSP